MDCRSAELQDCWTTGLQECRTAGLPDCRDAGLLNSWTDGLPERGTYSGASQLVYKIAFEAEI